MLGKREEMLGDKMLEIKEPLLGHFESISLAEINRSPK
jgi:hypothetical protein